MTECLARRAGGRWYRRSRFPAQALAMELLARGYFVLVADSRSEGFDGPWRTGCLPDRRCGNRADADIWRN